MVADRINRRNKPQVLMVGEEKNRGKWKKAKVIRQLKGRGKENQIQRPLQLVCPLEIRSSHEGNSEEVAETSAWQNR